MTYKGYKDKKKRKKYLRSYMRDYRKNNPVIRIPQIKIDELKLQFPKAYDFLLTEKKKRKRRKKK